MIVGGYWGGGESIFFFFSITVLYCIILHCIALYCDVCVWVCIPCVPLVCLLSVEVREGIGSTMTGATGSWELLVSAGNWT